MNKFAFEAQNIDYQHPLVVVVIKFSKEITDLNIIIID